MLFLDEPTTGLDPRARSQVWDTIRGIIAGGATVLLTTQYLEEADELADQIAVIDHGLVVADGHAGRAEGADRRPDPGGAGGRPGADRAGGADRGRGDRGRGRRCVSDTGLVTAPASDPAHAAGRGPAAGRGRASLAAELAFRLPSLDEVFLTPDRAPGRGRPPTSETGRAA